jgi:hypothetical protein
LKVVAQYDLRAAERARDRLQGSEISGRPVRHPESHNCLFNNHSNQIDVHYSLPRDDQKGAEREKNQVIRTSIDVTHLGLTIQKQMQGTLQVTLRGSQTGHIDDGELRRKFQQFGDIKSIRPIGDRFE